jgi:hypothetical protein
MDNKNSTKAIRYLDGGDVCGFVFVFVGVVAGSGGGGGRVHLIDHSMDILIPQPFQPPSPQKLVGCGVVEVGDLVVWSNSTTQRQNLPPLSRKNCPKSPQKVKPPRHPPAISAQISLSFI